MPAFQKHTTDGCQPSGHSILCQPMSQAPGDIAAAILLTHPGISAQICRPALAEHHSLRPHDAQETEVESAAEAGLHAAEHDVEESSWPGMSADPVMSAEAYHAPDQAGAQQGSAEEGAMDLEALRPGMPVEAQHAADSADAQQGYPEEGAMDPEALRRAMQRAMQGQGGSSRPARHGPVLEGSRPMAEALGRTQTGTLLIGGLANNVTVTVGKTLGCQRSLCRNHGGWGTRCALL